MNADEPPSLLAALKPFFAEIESDHEKSVVIRITQACLPVHTLDLETVKISLEMLNYRS